MQDPAAGVSLLDEWLASPTRDIHAHLAGFPSLSERPLYGPGFYSSSPPAAAPSVRTSSSMAPCIHQSSSASQHPPSLFNFSETTPTETSISTGLASRFSGFQLLEDNNGVLERPQNSIRQPIYECSFWFLSCSYISTDIDEWRTHCLSHFRGEEPPRSVQCPLCDEFKLTCENGWAAWDHRTDHIAAHHSVGHRLRTSRPDFHLFQHLWQKRLIDDHDLKELKGGNHNLERPPANFVVTGRGGGGGRSNRHESRRRGHQHVGRRPQ